MAGNPEEFFMGRALRGTMWVLLALSIGVLSWESYRVARAEMRTAQVLAEWRAKPRPLELSDLTDEQKGILLAIEDPAFYTHNGLDFSSPGQGLTTITQSLVKFLYFERFTPGFAKIEQSLIARLVLNRHMSKDEQLDLFINQAYFGQREGNEVRGFGMAAQSYFGKRFGELTRDEYIGLVAMLIGPNAVRPDRPKAYSERVGRIKALLAGKCMPDGLLDAYLEGCKQQAPT